MQHSLCLLQTYTIFLLWKPTQKNHLDISWKVSFVFQKKFLLT